MKPYPFSAIVGHDQLRLALILCAVRPEIGGVLIRGEKGTAKSTAVRGLAALLSHGAESRLVELPIGATEDRVIGSLDLQRVLRDGEHAFSPGLLARAHGGVLYVDEVNLLHDHLVDLLLDAAAMGRVHIERDGISHSHEARFVLIGTMNPEEGELRPQLLDRFGLTVDVRASRDVEVRAQVIRQRMAYEADPDAFAERYAPPTPSWPAGSPRPASRSPLWCWGTTSYAGSPRCARRSRSTACAPIWSWPHRGGACRLARSRHRRRRRHPGGGRVGVAAPAPPRSVRRPRPGPRPARRRTGPGRRPRPEPEPDPPAVAERR
ncbi:AAA domain family protein [Mycobacterium xenopi 4042]|uniref:AAA domain family protein n=1 Tax=Mycobacterium xenopi 4042 TaxID=1299334 RepID=X8E5W8_MYCXE|nr:AAA domain family protein [Mycobacterium xenopi 4042]